MEDGACVSLNSRKLNLSLLLLFYLFLKILKDLLELFLLLEVERTNDVNLCINFKDIIHSVHQAYDARIFGHQPFLHVSSTKLVAEPVLVWLFLIILKDLLELFLLL